MIAYKYIAYHKISQGKCICNTFFFRKATSRLDGIGIQVNWLIGELKGELKGDSIIYADK